jgi:hypothetical protein
MAMGIGIHDLGELAWKLDISMNVVIARVFHLFIAHGFEHCGGLSGRIARQDSTSNVQIHKRSL